VLVAVSNGWKLIVVAEFVPREAAAQVVGIQTSPEGGQEDQCIFSGLFGFQCVGNAVVSACAEFFFLVGKE
jgi:hypothetical protein